MLSNDNFSDIIPPASILVGMLFCNPVAGMAISRIGNLGYSAYLVGGYTGFFTSNKLVQYYSDNSEKYFDFFKNLMIDSNYIFLLPKYNFNTFLKKKDISVNESKKIIYTIIKHILKNNEHPLGSFYQQVLHFYKGCSYKSNNVSIIKDCQRILLIMEFIFQKVYFQNHSNYYQNFSEYTIILEKVKKKSLNILEISDELVNTKYSVLFSRYLQEIIMNDLYSDVIKFYNYVFEKEEKEIESKMRLYKYLPIEDLPFDISKEINLIEISKVNKLFKLFNKMETGYRKLKIIIKS